MSAIDIDLKAKKKKAAKIAKRNETIKPITQDAKKYFSKIRTAVKKQK